MEDGCSYGCSVVDKARALYYHLGLGRRDQQGSTLLGGVVRSQIAIANGHRRRSQYLNGTACGALKDKACQLNVGAGRCRHNGMRPTLRVNDALTSSFTLEVDRLGQRQTFRRWLDDPEGAQDYRHFFSSEEAWSDFLRDVLLLPLIPLLLPPFCSSLPLLQFLP